MPKDYISPSRKLWKWLKEQGITFEVDGDAPCVARSPIPIPPLGDRYEVKLRNDTSLRDYTCPFFGPGGSDNTMKALRGWIRKNGLWIIDSVTEADIIGWRLYALETPDIFVAKGKTDGIALCALLEKLMEESK